MPLSRYVKVCVGGWGEGRGGEGGLCLSAVMWGLSCFSMFVPTILPSPALWCPPPPSPRTPAPLTTLPYVVCQVGRFLKDQDLQLVRELPNAAEWEKKGDRDLAALLCQETVNVRPGGPLRGVGGRG